MSREPLVFDGWFGLVFDVACISGWQMKIYGLPIFTSPRGLGLSFVYTLES